MKRAGMILMSVCAIATVLLFALWVLGFAFAGAGVGNLIHILLVLTVLTGIGAFIGLILFIIGIATTKSDN